MKFRLSDAAELDLENIYASGCRIFGPQQADRYQDGLEAVFDFLARHPEAARERTEIVPPVRAHPYRAHVVIYVIQDGCIFIVRVRHGHENWSADPDGPDALDN